jgi:hypothetical protein
MVIKKSIYCALLILFLIPANGRSRLGDYYLGFGVSALEHETFDSGAKADLFLNIPIFDNSDINLYLSYSTYGLMGYTENFTEVGVDYIYHFKEYDLFEDLFLPYMGIGISYGSVSGLDNFFLNSQAGLDFPINDFFSLNPMVSFYGPWDDFSIIEVEYNLFLNWLINESHALALKVSRGAFFESDYIGVEYMYTWGKRKRRKFGF